MPMPHRTQMALIKRRIAGKEGAERIRELRSILAGLPDYKNGPYADLRKWVVGQIDSARARSRVVQRDSIAVRREGVAQVALVGPPNAGKSSLLHALSSVQVKIGDYAFTTLRPVPALVSIGGALVQFVEIPGLIEGASEDRGGGRALLGVLRGADVIVYCQDATESPQALLTVRDEVAAAGIERPTLLALTKMDDASSDALDGLRAAFRDLEDAIPVSIIDDESLEALKEAVWRLTGLIRIFLCHQGVVAERPLALPAGSTTLEVARSVHGELAQSFRRARVWRGSVRFEGQYVGRNHVLQEGDVVEVLT
jgi:small GTP-binding protein